MTTPCAGGYGARRPRIAAPAAGPAAGAAVTGTWPRTAPPASSSASAFDEPASHSLCDELRCLLIRAQVVESGDDLAGGARDGPGERLEERRREMGRTLPAAEDDDARGHVAIPVNGALVERCDLLVFGEAGFEEGLDLPPPGTSYERAQD